MTTFKHTGTQTIKSGSTTIRVRNVINTLTNQEKTVYTYESLRDLTSEEYEDLIENQEIVVEFDNIDYSSCSYKNDEGLYILSDELYGSPNFDEAMYVMHNCYVDTLDELIEDFTTNQEDA